VRDLAKLFRTSSWPLANVKAGVASLTFPVYHKPCLFARHYTSEIYDRLGGDQPVKGGV
jgi:hypothetical protein